MDGWGGAVASTLLPFALRKSNGGHPRTATGGVPTAESRAGSSTRQQNTHEVGPNSFYLTIDQYSTVRTHLLEPYRGTYWATRSAQRSYPTTTRQAVTAEEEQMKFMHGFVWPIHLHPSVKMSNLLSWCISDPPPIYMNNVHVTS